MRSEKNIKFIVLAVFIVMALVAAVPFWLDRSNAAMVHELGRELDQQQRLDSILNALRDAETGQRGFVITGNEAFLQPYYQARQLLPAAIGTAKQNSHSDAERAGVWRIAHVAELKLAELDETIAMRRNEGFARTEQVVSTMRGKRYMDELRQLVSAEQAHTLARREALRAGILAASSRSFYLSLFATVVNICVLGALLLMLARMLRERQGAARQLERKAGQLATTVEQTRRHNRELRIVAAMLRAVEALPSGLDAGPVVARGFSRLLPVAGGTFFARIDGDETLRRLSHWGKTSDQPAQLLPDDCQGLQRSRGADGVMRLSIPLVTQDELVGLIRLEGLPRESAAYEEQERLAVTAAEQLALALGNARLRDSLRRQSVLDPLTGLFNRRYFDETFRRELARARRMGAPLSLVVLDVDHFKHVNDSFGHAAGDAVLRAIAQLVRQSIRDGDVACRYGGEELVILMPDCAHHDAARRAETLRIGIAGAAPMLDDAGPKLITASFGVAEYPLHGADADTLFWAADKALYQAKRDGRNRVVSASRA